MLGCSITLADIQLAQGRLRGAMRTYDQALALASRHGNPALRGTVDMRVGRAAVLLELDDLAGARSELARSRELGEHAGLPQNAYRWRVVMAQVCEAEGDPGAAIALLDEAEALYEGDFSPNIRPVPAVRARAWIRQGRRDEVLAWLERVGPSTTDELSYVHEFEHVTVARALLAEHSPAGDEQALELLGRLERAASDADRAGSVIEIRVLEALAHHRRADTTRALESLDVALRLAEPEGYVRTFLAEGAPMASLLTASVARDGDPSYARRLLAGFAVTPDRSAPAMVETLSSRERDVLRLLATDLNGPEIARELVVSLNTVRTHTKNLYMKLGVNSRRAALSRARELDLL